MLIKRENTILDVTKGAYEDIFKSQGWKPTKSKGKGKKPETTFMNPQPFNGGEVDKDEVPFGNVLDPNEEDDGEDEEDYEVVLDEMTVKELVEFAAENDIDLEGKTRKDEIIDAIEEAMEE